MAAKTVEALLNDIRLLGEERYQLTESIRSLIKKTFPSVSEEVKYGGILFSSGVPFCGIFTYKQHVSLEFGKGALIVDTLGHLEGSGRGRRHLKLRSQGDIEAKQVSYYLPLALNAAKGCSGTS